MAKGRNKAKKTKGACSLAAAGIISPRAPRTVKTGDFFVSHTKTGGACNREGYIALVCQGSKCFRINWMRIERRWQSGKNQHMTMRAKFSFSWMDWTDVSCRCISLWLWCITPLPKDKSYIQFTIGAL